MTVLHGQFAAVVISAFTDSPFDPDLIEPTPGSVEVVVPRVVSDCTAQLDQVASLVSQRASISITLPDVCGVICVFPPLTRN